MIYPMPKIESIDELKKILETNRQVELKFTKKDGTLRYMVCTRNPNALPEREPKAVTEFQKVKDQLEILKQIRVYDIEYKGWRTINYDTIEWVIFKNDKGDLSAFQIVPEKNVENIGYTLDVPHTFELQK